jgi:2-methylcitrate dehydratase PrpD
MRLDETKTAHALSTALIMAAPGTGHHAASTTARWLAIGHAAARGVQAAQAAAAGFTSDLKLADGDFLKGIYGLSANAAVLGNGLGGLALSQVSFKPWCAARQTMAATQALKDVLAEGIPAESIARIGVAVLPQHLKMIDHGVTPGDRFSHLTSVTYQIALAAVAPDEAYGLSHSGPLNPAVANFMSRIKVRAEDGLAAAGYPQAWAAHLTIVAGPKRHERTVTHVPGDPARPFSENDVRTKFERVTAPVLGGNGAATFTHALKALDKPAAILAEIERIAALR